MHAKHGSHRPQDHITHFWKSTFQSTLPDILRFWALAVTQIMGGEMGIWLPLRESLELVTPLKNSDRELVCRKWKGKRREKADFQRIRESWANSLKSGTLRHVGNAPHGPSCILAKNVCKMWWVGKCRLLDCISGKQGFIVFDMTKSYHANPGRDQLCL